MVIAVRALASAPGVILYGTHAKDQADKAAREDDQEGIRGRTYHPFWKDVLGGQGGGGGK